MGKLSWLASADEFSVNILKAKVYKTKPGGIFSIIFFNIISLGILVCTVLVYFIQSSEESLTYSRTVEAGKGKIINYSTFLSLSLRCFSEECKGEESFKLINDYYKFIYVERKGYNLTGSIIKPDISSLNLNFTFNTSNIYLGNENGFPRITLLSCKSIKDLPISIDKKDLENCKEDIENFYSNHLINGTFFVFISNIDNYLFDTSKAKIKKTILSNNFPFQFEYNSHISYEFLKKNFAFNLDNKLFKTNNDVLNFTNWSTLVHTKTRSLSKNFDFSFLFSTREEDVYRVYKFYKTPFFTYLSNMGTFYVFLDIFLFIPFLWYSYFVFKLVVKFYSLKNLEKVKEEEALLQVDWKSVGYFKWLGIRFGCSKRSKELNKEISRMRKELSSHYENLYSRTSINREEMKEELDQFSLYPTENSIVENIKDY